MPIVKSIKVMIPHAQISIAYIIIIKKTIFFWIIIADSIFNFLLYIREYNPSLRVIQARDREEFQLFY